MEKEGLFVLNAIAQAIFDKKGMNILAIDVRECSSLTNYVIIAEGAVDKHVVAIAHSIERALREVGLEPSHQEGLKNGDWVVMDYFDVMVHLFVPGVREKYGLEELWRDGHIVDLAIDVSALKSVGYEAPRGIALF